tara:strand:- start:184 stop:480 length:297 start_codon:yes stop_codon:yes gene_type:complete
MAQWSEFRRPAPTKGTVTPWPEVTQKYNDGSGEELKECHVRAIAVKGLNKLLKGILVDPEYREVAKEWLSPSEWKVFEKMHAEEVKKKVDEFKESQHG